MKRLFFFLFIALSILALAGFNLSSAINIEYQEGFSQAYHPENLIRLHIKANSNLKEDQVLKMTVRDRLLEETRNLFEEVSTQERAEEILKTNLHRFREIVVEVLKENGQNLNTEVEYREILFPRQRYGEIDLPLGFYPALQVTIGEGVGDNWWCVLFPPLCFIDAIQEVEVEEEEIGEGETSEIPLEFRFRFTHTYSQLASYLEDIHAWVVEQELFGSRVRALKE